MRLLGQSLRWKILLCNNLQRFCEVDEEDEDEENLTLPITVGLQS
jgi:hypothetical protein